MEKPTYEELDEIRTALSRRIGVLALENRALRESRDTLQRHNTALEARVYAANQPPKQDPEHGMYLRIEVPINGIDLRAVEIVTHENWGYLFRNHMPNEIKGIIEDAITSRIQQSLASDGATDNEQLGVETAILDEASALYEKLRREEIIRQQESPVTL